MNIFQSKYKVLDKIGEGSFSEVLKCEHKESGVCYAAKRLKKVYKTEAAIMGCAEIIASQKLPYHPNILTMLEYHYDSFTGKVTFIHELMDMSMHDYLKTKRRGLSEHRVKNYLFQMLRGLEHLHRHGLFHRDVKPENILIKFPSILYSPLSQANPNEIIKLADLGSVRGIFSTPPYTEYISTRWYRSPECLLTIGNYGSKMDIWAAGCVFYEMITLSPLFPGSNEIDQLSKIHQILGSPSIQFLSRLKTKSRNCIFFPKLKGTGVDGLLPFITRNGRNVLRLMIEYDPEKRINVRRLLRNGYFDDTRDKFEIREMRTPQIKTQVWYKPSEGLKRSMGDDVTISANHNLVKPKILKRDHSDQLSKSSNESSKSGQNVKKNCKSKSSGTPTIEIPYYTRKSVVVNKGDTNSYSKVSSLPLVEYKVLKALGENPTIIKPRDPIKNRFLRSRTVKKDPNQRYFATTSHLETIKCEVDAKISSKNHFQSKSFVLPRRPGQHKIDTINDEYIGDHLHTSMKQKIYREMRHT